MAGWYRLIGDDCAFYLNIDSCIDYKKLLIGFYWWLITIDGPIITNAHNFYWPIKKNFSLFMVFEYIFLMVQIAHWLSSAINNTNNNHYLICLISFRTNLPPYQLDFTVIKKYLSSVTTVYNHNTTTANHYKPWLMTMNIIVDHHY